MGDTYENFVLSEGLEKVTVRDDAKLPNCGVFTILCEDHTIGNLIRCKLHEDKHVIFAGYRITHPMKYDISLRIQTDGAQIMNLIINCKEFWTPKKAFNFALAKLEEEFIELY